MPAETPGPEPAEMTPAMKGYQARMLNKEVEDATGDNPHLKYKDWEGIREFEDASADQLNSDAEWESDVEKPGLTSKEWHEIEELKTSGDLEDMAETKKRSNAAKRGWATRMNKLVSGGDDDRNPNLTYLQWQQVKEIMSTDPGEADPATPGTGEADPADPDEGESTPSPELVDAKDKLADIERQVAGLESEFAKLSASQRNADVGRLAEGGRVKKWLRKHLPGLKGKVEKSNQTDAEIKTAMDTLNQAKLEAAKLADKVFELSGATEAERREYGELGHAKELLRLSQAIQSERESQNPNSKFWNKLADRWSRAGKFQKVAIVAVPALAVGLTGGAAAAAFGLSGLGLKAAGLATAVVGKNIGKGIGSRVNRGLGSTEAGKTQAKEKFEEQLTTLKQTYDSGENVFGKDTEMIDQDTLEITRANRSRRNKAKAIGGIAAGLGFAVGNAASPLEFGADKTPDPTEGWTQKDFSNFEKMMEWRGDQYADMGLDPNTLPPEEVAKIDKDLAKGFVTFLENADKIKR